MAKNINNEYLVVSKALDLDFTFSIYFCNIDECACAYKPLETFKVFSESATPSYLLFYPLPYERATNVTVMNVSSFMNQTQDTVLVCNHFMVSKLNFAYVGVVGTRWSNDLSLQSSRRPHNCAESNIRSV